MRAIIRVIIPEITDEKAIETKKAIEKLLKDIPDVEVDVSLLGR